MNIDMAKSQAQPSSQVYRILKTGKFSYAYCNRPQPLMIRGSSIWWRGQMDFGFW